MAPWRAEAVAKGVEAEGLESGAEASISPDWEAERSQRVWPLVSKELAQARG